jgi:hypothetical protein
MLILTFAALLAFTVLIRGHLDHMELRERVRENLTRDLSGL